jgi:hypothetical protein
LAAVSDSHKDRGSTSHTHDRVSLSPPLFDTQPTYQAIAATRCASTDDFSGKFHGFVSGQEKVLLYNTPVSTPSKIDITV